MVVPLTAHAAFDKAAGLLGIELRHFAVDPTTFRALPSVARSCIDSNTIVVVGSAPSFAQGVIDPIQELAAAAKAVGAGCHVDCCLGSFLIAYTKRFKVLTPHDFSVDGVTSISVDTHKFGFAPKGSSVILYRDAELRRFQYFSAPRWTGGIYATATVAGSRPGALIAGCWAVMAHIGDDGCVHRLYDFSLPQQPNLRSDTSSRPLQS
jgi:sphinganine-1-phosphate aldolase